MSSFTRNASCPTQNTLASQTNCLIHRKHSSSIHSLHYSSNPSVNSKNKSPQTLLQRLKTSVVNFFKHISKENSSINLHHSQQMDTEQSTFLYDPELDISEEYLSLISKRILTTLKDGKIKHLSCDNLFLPCNHIRNIAKQCLIMSAEEPFGIMGAQIKIKFISEKSNIIKYLPILRINAKQKATFEIEIDLHEDTKVFTLRRFLPEMKMFKDLKEKGSLYVSPRCILVKNVFYKTAQPKRAILDS